MNTSMMSSTIITLERLKDDVTSSYNKMNDARSDYVKVLAKLIVFCPVKIGDIIHSQTVKDTWCHHGMRSFVVDNISVDYVHHSISRMRFAFKIQGRLLKSDGTPSQYTATQYRPF